jgi:hypothetical protein
MSDRKTDPVQRGGGDRGRVDAFRYAPGRVGIAAFVSTGALGAVAIAVVSLDLGGAQARAGAAWVAPAGVLLIAMTIGLIWLTRRAPVLLTVGPEGLDLPAALARPVAWAEIWRIRLAVRRAFLRPRFAMLTVDLIRGVRPRYRRRPWTWPSVDAWLVRKLGLRVPIHNLDAAEAVILASVERFKPVERVRP